MSGGIALTIDSADRLHAGWSMFNQAGFGEVVYYTRSEDQGQTWERPLLVGIKAESDYESDWLNIATVGDNQVYLVWTGIGRPPGRIYRISKDSGLSFTEPIPFMNGWVGETESPRMVVDSGGTVHLFTPARDRETSRISGVHYLYWLGRFWSEPLLLEGPGENPSSYGALRMTATISLGSEIFAFWIDEGRGEIFGVNGRSNSSIQPATPFVPTLDDSLINDRHVDEAGSGSQDNLLQPTPVTPDFTGSTPQSSGASSTIMLAILFPLIFISIVASIHLRRRR